MKTCKYKRIIYMAVAVFTLASFLFANTAKVFAESFNADKYDAGWRYYKVNQSNNGGTDADNGACSPFVDLNAIAPDSFHAGVGTKKYSEYLSFANLNQNSTSGYLYNYTIESDSEIVMFFDYSLNQSNHDFINEYLGSNKQMGRPFLYYLSKSEMVCSYKQFSYNGTSFSLNTTSSTMGWTESKSYNDMTYYCAYDTSSFYNFAINSHKMKVFDSMQEALTYLQTGIGKPAWEGSDVAGYDADNLYCTQMDIIYHDSNVFDNCYIEFIYQLPDSLKDTEGLYISIFEEYDMGSKSLTGVKDSFNTSGKNVFSLDDYPFSYKLYLKDVEALQNYFSQNETYFNDDSTRKRQILGSEYNKRWNDNIGYTNIVFQLNLSKLYLYANICHAGVMGEQYNHSIDLINGSTDFHSSRPDESGNYTTNGDFKKTGHYYNEVGTDVAGNTTNKYYYYGDDNQRIEISAEDFLNNKSTNFDISADVGFGGGGSATGDNSNNNVNNPTFNNNNNVTVTVEGDSINNDVNNIINNDTSNSKENSENFITKFLGFFNVLENNSFLSILGKLFGWLPVPVYAVITGSIGIIAGVSVFRFFHK